MYPGEAPRYLTLVFESAMDEFIGKDEAFVEQWLVCQGLDRETGTIFCSSQNNH